MKYAFGVLGFIALCTAIVILAIKVHWAFGLLILFVNLHVEGDSK